MSDCFIDHLIPVARPECCSRLLLFMFTLPLSINSDQIKAKYSMKKTKKTKKKTFMHRTAGIGKYAAYRVYS